MRIEYNFSNNNSTNIVEADEMTLRYYLFLGSIILKKDRGSININWDWIPLLDFALCLLEICRNLSIQTNGQQEFEFTESDAKLIFDKRLNKISVTTSFSNETLEISLEELQTVAKEFYKDVINDILVKNENIKENIVFAKYLQEAKEL